MSIFTSFMQPYLISGKAVPGPAVDIDSHLLSKARTMTDLVIAPPYWTFVVMPAGIDRGVLVDDERVDCRGTSHPHFFAISKDRPFGADCPGITNLPTYVNHFDPTWLESLALEIFDEAHVVFDGPYGQSVTNPYLMSDLDRFFDESSRATADSRIVAESLSTLIAIEFLRLGLGKEPDRSLGRMRHPGIVRARKAMHTDYRDPLTIPRLAQIACLSPSQFQAAFVKEVGQTPHEYLTAVRIQAAKRLLDRRDVETVSRLVGFETRFGFDRAFRRVFGVTPSQYRTMLRQ